MILDVVCRNRRGAEERMGLWRRISHSNLGSLPSRDPNGAFRAVSSTWYKKNDGLQSCVWSKNHLNFIAMAVPDVMANSKVETKTEPQVEAADAYPARKMVIPAMIAVYLAVFLIALVW